MRFVPRLVTVMTLAAGGLAACSSDTTNPFAPLALSLSLTPSVDTIFVGDTITAANFSQLELSATSLGSAVSTPAGVEWTSSNPNVATVTTGGMVVAQGLGTTTVKARVNSSTAHADVVVAQRVSQLRLSVTSISGVVGDSVQFTASALDRQGILVPGTAYTFTSDDPAVARVTSPSNRTARVVFLKTGLAKVTVRAGGQTVSVTGSVQAP